MIVFVSKEITVSGDVGELHISFDGVKFTLDYETEVYAGDVPGLIEAFAALQSKYDTESDQDG